MASDKEIKAALSAWCNIVGRAPREKRPEEQRPTAMQWAEDAIKLGTDGMRAALEAAERVRGSQ